MSTEAASPYDNLEHWTPRQILEAMNAEDQRVALAVQAALPAVEALVERALPCLREGGRLFYLGAGTSGRLGVLDAAECPPTFGVPPQLVVGLIAGGDRALREPVEGAEDDAGAGWADLQRHHASPPDVVVGLSASGGAAYVVQAVAQARRQGLLTAAITCRPESALAATAECRIVLNTGPEFLTGSTRLKAGTAQKMVLNMISTSLMIGLGRVKGNRMVDMQLVNAKLVERGTRFVMEMTGCTEAVARERLLAHGSVRAAAESLLGTH